MVVASLVGTLLATTATPSPAATAAECGKLLAPTGGVYFGLMPGWQLIPSNYDDNVDPNLVRGVESLTGRKVAFATFEQTWHDGLQFPLGEVQGLWRLGYVPLVRIFTFPTMDFYPGALPVSQYPGPISMGAVAAGQFDAPLRGWADAARKTDIPILLDIDPEMNSAHPWGGRFDGGATTTGYGDPNWPDGPERFRDGYRHIVNVFRAEGATNVTFFFHPNTVFGYAPGSYTPPFEQMHWYFPGDDYVDWIGLSVYGLPNHPDGSNESFEENLQTFGDPAYTGSYTEITSLSTRPLAINELGLDSMPNEQAKADWVTQASAVIQSGRYPRIAAVNWWGDRGNGQFDGYPGRSPTFLAAWKAAFDQPFFDAKPQFGGDCLPPPPRITSTSRIRITWAALPNATSYEVWRNGRRVATTTATSYRGKPGSYRVRGLNPLGAGPFS